MKKQIFFPCTILRPFLVSIPLVLVMAAAIRLNDAVDTLMKLYPLIIACGAAIVFTFVYFFRAILVSKDEVRYIGAFSSRDSAVINEGKTLIFTLKNKNKIAIDLYGNDGVNAELDWLRGETVHDTYLFRGKAVGGVGALSSVLRFFELPSEDIDRLLDSEELTLEYDDYTVKIGESSGERELRITFKKTL